MVKRIVDTDFWSNMDVLDNYSVEDKFFALYLMTNAKSTQVGIYSLPKKIISFETGFTTEVIQVLLDRFSSKYGQILYSEETQEITLLRSLEYSIIKGGKPVSDLLERELRNIQDGRLILSTYQIMKDFWESSKRKFDHTIQEIFEGELINRELLIPDYENDNQNDNEKDNEKDNDNKDDNDKKNDNDNEGSYSANHSPEEVLNRGANRQLLIAEDKSLSEEAHIKKYLEFLKFRNPSFEQPMNTEGILAICYKELFGELSLYIQKKIEKWEEVLPKSVILEAFTRSVNKSKPIYYISTIINNWLDLGVTNLCDVSSLDEEFKRKNS